MPPALQFRAACAMVDQLAAVTPATTVKAAPKVPSTKPQIANPFALDTSVFMATTTLFDGDNPTVLRNRK
jgi:hypothetical protein